MARQRLGFDRLECRRVLAADGQAVPGDADGAQPDIGSSDGASDGVSYQQFSDSTTSQLPGSLSGAPAKIDAVKSESGTITRPPLNGPHRTYGVDRSTYLVIDF